MKKVSFNSFFSILLFFCISIINQSLYAQKEAQLLSRLDSLTTHLERAKVYNKLSYIVRRSNTDKAIDYGQKALKFSQLAGSRKEEIDAIQNIAYPHYRQGKYDLALTLFEKSLQMAEKAKDTIAMITSLSYMGTTHNYKANFEKGLEYLNRALELSRATKDYDGICTVLNRMASIYRKVGEFEKALKCFEEALEISKLHLGNDKRRILETRHNIAVVFEAQGQFRTALEHFLDSYESLKGMKDSAEFSIGLGAIGMAYKSLGVYDSAFICFQQAVDYARQFKTPVLESFNLRNIAKLIVEMGGEPKEALTYAKKALKIIEASNINDDYGACLAYIGELYSNQDSLEAAKQYLLKSLEVTKGNNKGLKIGIFHRLGSIYLKERQQEQAKNHYEKALTLSRELNSEKYESLSFYYLAKLASSQAAIETAILYAEQSLKIAKKINYTAFYDELHEILAKNYAKMGNYEAAYEQQKALKTYADSILDREKQLTLAKLETQLKTKEKELENQILKANQAKNEAIIQRRNILGIALGAGLLLSILLAILYIQKAKSETKFQLRKQLTRDIHDDIGSILTNLKLTAKNVLEKAAPLDARKQELTQIVHYGDEALISMKNLIWGLEDTEGKSVTAFLKIIQDYTYSSLEQENVRFTINKKDFPPDLIFSNRRFHHLFMIYKETLQNILKHAPQSKVEIMMEKRDKQYIIEVKNTIKVSKRGIGQGIRNMKQRAKFIKGELDVFEKEGKNIVQLRIKDLV